MKKLKYLLFLLILIPFININALTLCDNTELPDIPTIRHYVIIKTSTGRYRAYGTINNNIRIVDNNGSITYYNYDSNDDIYYFQFNPNTQTDWQSMGTNSTAYSFTIYDNFIATTNNIVDSSDNVIYNGGYNIECSIPEPDTPQDFSIINYIASIYNNLISSLQENNISIHVTFLSLIIINFLIFVLCYFITHIE